MASDTVVAIDVSSTELVAPATTEDIDIPVPSPLGNAALDSDRGDETRIQRRIRDRLPHTPITIVANDLRFENADMESGGLLHGVSCVVRPGEKLAILGPSGSGKSLLLKILAGKIENPNLKGTVTYNGDPLNDNMSRIMAYMSPADELFPTLTVRETLSYEADMLLPGSIQDAERNELVEQILDDLGMRSCIDTKVGGGFIRGISGGQRRRLVLATNIIKQPLLWFLDSPTSGLDSTAAEAVMDEVFHLAKNQGTTIISTLSAPSYKLLQKFDQIIIMWKGHLLFHGTPSEAETFFEENGYSCPEEVNPADHWMKLINTDFEEGSSPDDVREIIGKFKDSRFFEALEQSVSSCKKESFKKEHFDKYARGAFSQFWTLTKRSFLNAFRNPANYWVRVAMYAMLSLMMGLAYLNIGNQESKVVDRTSLLWYSAAFFVFMSQAAVGVLLQERHVFVRERYNGEYSSLPYMLANTVSTMPWVFLIALVSSILIYFMVDLYSGRFGYFLAIFFFGLFAAESLVVAVSSVVPHFIVGLALCSLFFGFYMLVCGFFLPYPLIPGFWKYWAYFISMHTYMFEGLVYNELSGATFVCDGSQSFPAICTPGTTNFSGNRVLEGIYEILSDPRGRGIGVLVGMIVIYRVVAYMLLRFTRSNRGKSS